MLCFCRLCAVPLCPVKSRLLRSACGQTWWSRSRCTVAKPTITPASRGQTAPAPGTAASHHPKRSSWMPRTPKHMRLHATEPDGDKCTQFQWNKVIFFFFIIKKKKKAKLMWQKWPAGLKTTLCHSLCLERLRGCSQTQQLCKNNKTASWDIDWSSDVTSSWGWRQEDKNSQWDRALPAPSKQFLTALISTNQFPVFRQPLVIHHLPAFITSSSSFLYSKAKFQVAFIIIFFHFILFKTIVSLSLRALLIHSFLIVSAGNFFSRPHDDTLSLKRSWIILHGRWSSLVSLGGDFRDRHWPHWTSLCCVKMSALNLNTTSPLPQRPIRNISNFSHFLLLSSSSRPPLFFVM